MNFEASSSATDDCQVQQFGQSETEGDEFRNHPTLSHRSELMEIFNKSKVLQEPHLQENPTRKEMELTRGQVQSDSRFDVGMELVQEQSCPHFGVHEHLEVQLRFDLGALDGAHLLLDANGPRDGHWGVDFMRQEQSEIAFQTSSEEGASLIASESNVKGVKSYLSCQSWPSVSHSREDDCMAFEAVVQSEVDVVPDAFNSNCSKPADESEALQGQSLTAHVKQKHENTWIDVNGRQHSQHNANALLETNVVNNNQRGQAVCITGQGNVDVQPIQFNDVVQIHKQTEIDYTVDLVDTKETRDNDISSSEDFLEHLPMEAKGLQVWNATVTQPFHLESCLKLKVCDSKTTVEPSVTIGQHLSEVRQSDHPNMSSKILSKTEGHSEGKALECEQATEEPSMFSASRKLYLQVDCDGEESNRSEGNLSLQCDEEGKHNTSETLNKESDQGAVGMNEDTKGETMAGITHSLPGSTLLKKESPPVNPFVCKLSGSDIREPLNCEEVVVIDLSKSSEGCFPVCSLNAREVQGSESRDGAREVGETAPSGGDSHVVMGEAVLWSEVALQEQDGLCLVSDIDTNNQNTIPVCVEDLQTVMDGYKVKQTDGANCILSANSTKLVQNSGTDCSTSCERKSVSEFATHPFSEVVSGLGDSKCVIASPGHLPDLAEDTHNSGTQVHTSSVVQSIAPKKVAIPSEVPSQDVDTMMTDAKNCTRTSTQGSALMGNSTMKLLQGENLQSESTAVSCSSSVVQMDGYIHASSGKEISIDCEKVHESTVQITGTVIAGQGPFSSDTVEELVPSDSTGVIESSQDGHGCIMVVQESPKASDETLQGISKVVGDITKTLSPAVVATISAMPSLTGRGDLSVDETHMGEYKEQWEEDSSDAHTSSKVSRAYVSTGFGAENHPLEAIPHKRLEQGFSASNLHVPSEKSIAGILAAEFDGKLCDSEAVGEKIKSSEDCEDIMSLPLKNVQTTTTSHSEGESYVCSGLGSRETAADFSKPLMQDSAETNHKIQSDLEEGESKSTLAVNEAKFIAIKAPEEVKDMQVNKGCDLESSHSIGQKHMNCKKTTIEGGFEGASCKLYSQLEHTLFGLSKVTTGDKDATPLELEKAVDMSKVNAVHHFGDEGMLNSGEPASLCNACDGSNGATDDKMLPKSVPDSMSQLHVTDQIGSSPQQRGDLLTKNVTTAGMEKTAEVSEQTVFDNKTMQIQKDVPMVCSDEERKQQNANVSVFCSHLTSELNSVALRADETSQEPIRSEMMIGSVASFTETVTCDMETTKTLQGKGAQAQGEQSVSAIPVINSETESACGSKASCSLVLKLENEDDMSVMFSCPLNAHMLQVEKKEVVGTRCVEDRSSEKKVESLQKFLVCRQEDGGKFSYSESIVCEMNPQHSTPSELYASKSFEEASGSGNLATVDGSVSDVGKKTVSISVPLHAKVPVHVIEGADKHFISRQEFQSCSESVDMNISSASDVGVSRNNVLGQREISVSVTACPAPSLSKPQTIHCPSRKGLPLHLQSQVTMPDLNVMEFAQAPLAKQPFTDSQQVQLRAQILVYGSLIQGALPEEALMIAAFSDINGASKDTHRAATGGGRVFWEKSWHATAERIQGKVLFTVPKEPVLSTALSLPDSSPCLLTKISDEGGRVSSLLSNSATGKIISSTDARVHPVPSIRLPETAVSKGHITKSRQIPSTGSGKLGSKSPAAFLNTSYVSNLSCSSHVIPSPLSDNVQCSQTAKPHQVESQRLAPRAVFPTGQLSPFIPLSGHWTSPPTFLGSTWLPQSHSTMFDSTVSFTPLQSSAGCEVSHAVASGWRSLTSSRLPFASVTPASTSSNVPIIGSSSNVGSTTIDSGLLQKNSSVANRQVTLDSRSRKRKKSQMEASLPVAMISGSLPLIESTLVMSSLASTALNTPIRCPPSSQVVSSTLVISGSPLMPSPKSLAMIIVTSHLATPIIETPVCTFPKNGISASLLTGRSSVVASPMQPYQVISAGSSVLSENAMHELEQAKLNAEEANSFAASTVKHSEFIWRQLQVQKTSGVLSDKDLKLASSAVALAAAASVAKAAAAAARVAYEAALQAKVMGEEAMDVSNHCSTSGIIVDQLMQPQQCSGVAQDQQENGRNAFGTWEMPSNCKSIITTAREAAKKRLEAASAARTRAQNLESVVRAAELAAMAVSQAGAVVAMGEPMPFTLDMLLDAGPEGLNRLGNVESLTDSMKKDKVNPIGSTVRSQSRTAKLTKELDYSEKDVNKSDELREKCTQSSEVGEQSMENRVSGLAVFHQKDAEPREGTPRGVELRKDGADVEVVEVTEATAQSIVPPNEGAVAAEVEFGPSSRLKPSSASENQLMKDSVVEVLSDEDGLRGVWFSAKVLCVENGKALVIYDELLSDDGHSPLEEWIDLVNPSGEAPRVRLAHPMTKIKFEGTRKRRRAAMGNHVWCVGDHADAWIRDGWWEGEILDTCEEDESRVKVYFPGEGDTAFIKSWNLRPSLIWKEGHWVLWAELKLEGHQPEEEASGSKSEIPFVKRQKVDKGQNDTLNQGYEKVREVNSEENKRSQGPVVPSIGESQPDDSTKTRKEGNVSRTAKGAQEGQTIESSKVVFGVPKPTKKRKFIEVSKHYNSNRATRSSPRGEVRGKNDRKQGLESENQTGSDSINRAEDRKPKKKLPPKRLQVKERKDDEGSRNRSIPVRNDKVKHFPSFGMGPRKENSNQNTVMSSFPSGKSDGAKSAKKLASSYRQQSDLQKSNSRPITIMPKESSIRKQPILSKGGSVSTDAEHTMKGQKPLFASKEIEKVKIPAMPLAELSEPRRSSRRIQPTSKLLEGLQSTPKLGKIHHGF